MDDSSWRVLVLFDRKDDVRSVADFLKAMGEVTAAGGSVSHASGTTCLFAYAPDAGVIEKVARIISSAMDSLAVKPAQVGVARWLPDELAWRDEEHPSMLSGEGAELTTAEVVVSLFDPPV